MQHHAVRSRVRSRGYFVAAAIVRPTSSAREDGFVGCGEAGRRRVRIADDDVEASSHAARWIPGTASAPPLTIHRILSLVMANGGVLSLAMADG